MSSKLDITDDIKLPLDLAAQAIVEVGIRGSGKTNTGRRLAEQLVKAGVPICVVDPTDAWWGMRASRDGRGDGYPVFIFGGEHGDLPLEETNGKTIADFLVKERVPVICSLRHLRKNAQRRFVTELCEELYHLKGKPENRSPLTVFIDESPLFIPQRVLGEMARTVGAVEDLIARGRNAGFGVVLISQRFATINKDVSTQAGTIICHRLTSPQDRKAIAEWIEENATIEQQRETLQSLATLKNGEAWLWAPALEIYHRVQIKLSDTFDSGATPKMGVKPTEPKKLAEIDRDKLRARMTAAVEKSKANDPAELKKRIAELERQDAMLKDIAVIANKHGWDGVNNSKILSVFLDHALGGKKSAEPLVTDQQISRLEKLYDRAEKLPAAVSEKLAALFNPAMEAIHDVGPLLGQLLTAARTAVQKPIQPLKGHNPGAAAAVSRPTTKPVVLAVGARKVGTIANGLSRPQQRILDAVAWWNAIGVDAPSRLQVGFVAGIKPTGGHFSNTIGPLVTRGLIENVGDGVKLTETGTELANLPPATPTLGEYHNLLRSIIKSGATRRILDVIIDSGYENLTVEAIGERTGINAGGGHFSNSIGPLSTLGLIERGDGVVTVTKLLFPEGLR